MTAFPGRVNQGLSPCPLLFGRSFQDCPGAFAPQCTLITNSFPLLSAKSGLTDPKHDDQKAKPWTKAIVETPLVEAAQPTAPSSLRTFPHSHPRAGPNSTVLGWVGSFTWIHCILTITMRYKIEIKSTMQGHGSLTCHSHNFNSGLTGSTAHVFSIAHCSIQNGKTNGLFHLI